MKFKNLLGINVNECEKRLRKIKKRKKLGWSGHSENLFKKIKAKIKKDKDL